MSAKLYGTRCTDRQLQQTQPDAPFRSAFRRDYARFIHTPSFRRLQGKTQLYPGHESDFFRNRLTHSIEVAQIAKGIAQLLNYTNDYLRENPLDYDLVEFSALAHDLGHPPFGHNGEKALDDGMKEFGGFEGNAQTLRILSVIEKKETLTGELLGIARDGTDNRIGLNPSYRSLASILKYDEEIPICREKSADLVKGYYASEKELVSKIKGAIAPGFEGGAKFKTIECQIMDLADDIAYSTYDLEDGLKSGFVDPLMLVDTVIRGDGLLQSVTEKVQRECHSATPKVVAEAIARVLRFDIDGVPFVLKNPKSDGSNNVAPTPVQAYFMSKWFAGTGKAGTN